MRLLLDFSFSLYLSYKVLSKSYGNANKDNNLFLLLIDFTNSEKSFDSFIQKSILVFSYSLNYLRNRLKLVHQIVCNK